MPSEAATAAYSGHESLLQECAEALRRLASYRLPPALDQRLLWLSENKEALTDAERDELMAMAELTEQRTLDKTEAQALLKRMTEFFPYLKPASPRPT